MNYINQNNLNKLENLIGTKRYIHSKGVMDEAEKLAKIYNVDSYKAKISGLFHDCGKFLNKKMAYSFIKEHNLVYEKELLDNYQLLHSHFGVDVAKIIFNINDKEILDGIKYHTTLRKNPTQLDKIIYIADAIEPNRDYEGVEILKKLAYENIDKSIYVSLNETIKKLLEHNLYVGNDSIEARNYLLNKI